MHECHVITKPSFPARKEGTAGRWASGAIPDMVRPSSAYPGSTRTELGYCRPARGPKVGIEPQLSNGIEYSPQSQRSFRVRRSLSSMKGRGTMLKLFVALAAAVFAFALTPAAQAEERTLTTFVVHLSPENEVPKCTAGVESGANGVAVIQIDETTGEIRYRVVATNLPGTITGAHIHVGPAGVSPPMNIVQPLQPTDLQSGLVFAGTATNPTLASAILLNPANYYVNVHTQTCPTGAVRGQLA
jgi:CHRD domain